MVKHPANPEDNVFGISPVGGNSVDGTGAGSVQGVPLVYDRRYGAFVSEQAVEERDDEEVDRMVSERTLNDAAFLSRVGYRKA